MATRTGRDGYAVCEFSYRDHARNVTRLEWLMDSLQTYHTRNEIASMKCMTMKLERRSQAIYLSCDMCIYEPNIV